MSPNLISFKKRKRRGIIEFIPFLGEKMQIKFESLGQLENYIRKMERDEGIDVEPAIDERPFFHDFSLRPHWSFVSLCVIAIIVAISMILFTTRKRNYLLMSNFCLLGVGFMIVEITTIQKFIYFLGSPLLSLGIVLFSFLVSCGIGGLLTMNFSKSNMLILLPGILALLFFTITRFLTILDLMNEALKIISAVIITLTLGFLIGMFSPTIITMLAKNNGKDIGVAYGINGIMSVFGSVFAIIIAKYFGYKFNFLIAAIIYFIVYLIMSVSTEKS